MARRWREEAAWQEVAGKARGNAGRRTWRESRGDSCPSSTEDEEKLTTQRPQQRLPRAVPSSRSGLRTLAPHVFPAAAVLVADLPHVASQTFPREHRKERSPSCDATGAGFKGLQSPHAKEPGSYVGTEPGPLRTGTSSRIGGKLSTRPGRKAREGFPVSTGKG